MLNLPTLRPLFEYLSNAFKLTPHVVLLTEIQLQEFVINLG